MSKGLLLIILLIGFSAVSGQKPPRPYGVLPTNAQLRWHETEMYCIIHYGLNTYTDKEWGYGDVGASMLNPISFNARQIVRAAKAGGCKGVIVVAKHHDGFCLWPTATTDYNISKSPYKNGKGDIVQEFRNACDAENMKLGIYCSPWDRNTALYGSPDYVQQYRRQLQELYTRYGPLFISWHDGANGGDGYYGGAREKRTIDKTTYYGWDSSWAITRRMQPGAVLFGDIGPDVRWVGNEEGIAGETCWATYTPEAPDSGRIPSNGYSKYWMATEGTANGTYWMPAECDVPLRPGWFYHASQDKQVKSPATLLDLYYRSVGRGASLDLGLAPGPDGIMQKNDVEALKLLGDILRNTFATNLLKNASFKASNVRANAAGKFGTTFLTDGDRYSYWATDDTITQATLQADMPVTKEFNVIRLRENIKLGQRITSFEMDAWLNNNWQMIASATSIGANRLIKLPEGIATNKIRLRITGSHACIALSDFGLFKEPVLTAENVLSAADTIDIINGRHWVKTISDSSVTIDMGSVQALSGFTYLPRQDKKRDGVVEHYAWLVSVDGISWKTVAAGEFANIAANPVIQLTRLDKPIQTRYFRLIATKLLQGKYIAQSELGALSAPAPAFRNSSLPSETRVSSLLKELTLEEKISLLGYRSEAVTRLGIPAYNWWNEALHGVARAGLATVFPQAIGMAATFNDSLLKQVADVIATEARAKYNLSTAIDRRLQYMGLTFWSPNINIFRDPRWGRGQETYGEDPFLTAAMGTAFVKGLQGNDSRYLKTAACAKHFAVHSGPEAGRHSFNAIVDEKDMRETYLYAFKKLVGAGVESVMCAYNRLNDKPCCTNDILLRNILREEWKFKGHVVTDCGALDDIYQFHKVLTDPVEVAAAAIKTGVNLDCSNLLQKDVMAAYKRNLLTVTQIDSALAALLRTQFKLGFYDKKEEIPFSKLGEESVHNTRHIELARKAAQQSMILLRNNNNILPLEKNKYGSIVVLGANAGAMDPMVANYHGMSGNIVTFAEGITAAAGPATAVQYDQGSDYTDTSRFGGIWAAGESDLAITVIGLTPVLEGEEGDAFLAANGGDKLSLALPAAHIAFLKELRKKGKPVIAVVTAGSNVDIAAIEPYADAIVLAWYPGEQGGNALADILFGKVSPAGRLPVSFYKSLSDLPPYDSYSMQNRTYRYFKGKVQYPFGFGLSYTSFDYSWKQKPVEPVSLSDTISFSMTVKNTGKMDGDEVVQLYISYPAIERMPLKELKGFKRTTIQKGGKQVVQFKVPAVELQKWDMALRKWVLYKGEYRFLIGSSSEDIRLDYSMNIKDL